MIRKIMAIDLTPMEYIAKEMGFPYLPLSEIRDICSENDVDIVETLVTLPQRLPEDDSDESLARLTRRSERKRFALQMSGARIIDCPTKPSLNTASGFKPSDDQRLMLRTLMLAMKLRPTYVMLFAADGDYAPMVEFLREEGIRTEVVAKPSDLASKLRCQAVRCIDYVELLTRIIRQDQEGPCKYFDRPPQSSAETTG